MLKSDPAVSNWSTAKSQKALAWDLARQRLTREYLIILLIACVLIARDDCRFGQSGGENESCFFGSLDSH
jgi:hypothetical protein